MLTLATVQSWLCHQPGSKSCAIKESSFYNSGHYKIVLPWYIENIPSLSRIHEHDQKLCQAAVTKNLRQSCWN